MAARASHMSITPLEGLCLVYLVLHTLQDQRRARVCRAFPCVTADVAAALIARKSLVYARMERSSFLIELVRVIGRVGDFELEGAFRRQTLSDSVLLLKPQLQHVVVYADG